MHNRRAGNPDIGDLFAPSRVHDLRHDVIKRLCFDRRQIERDQICLLADFDRADAPIES